jgi:hypothetical protein
MKKTYLLISVLFLFTAGALAQDKKKVSYNLCRPVPGVELRDMETDRPDVTESPITVDAGHFQYESDLVQAGEGKKWPFYEGFVSV